jgi:hypothetical protein
VRILTHLLDLEGDLEEVLLLHAARIYRPCEATDLRDKIYALLRLLGGRRQDDVIAFTPNYDISVQDLYKEFARYFINKGYVYSILVLCDGSYQIQGLPSWTPDWTVPELVPEIEFFNNGLPLGDHFRASGDLPSDFTLSPDGDQFLSKGMLISQIKPTTSVVRPDDQTSAAVISTLVDGMLLVLDRDISERLDLMNDTGAFDQRYAEDLQQPYKAGGTKDDALGRAVRASPTGASTGAANTGEGWHTSEVDQTIQSPHSTNRNVADDGVRMFMVLRGRKVCVSYDGYIGIVSMQTKENDWICIFHGMSVSFILREHEDGYTLVGDCYVQDLMQGEAFKKLEGLLKEQTITLV